MRYWIFDFNGTIIDDVDVCIECENKTIEKYLNRPKMTRDEYLKIFTFPVEEYYRRVGFDWNVQDYKEIGSYWYSFYVLNRHKCKLHDGVEDLLQKNIENGDINICLSASKLSELKIQLEELKIKKYFKTILGIDNIYAGGKIEIAKEFIKDKNPNDCLMIGDTLHDKEVALEMGVRCVLVSKGHQSKEILEKGHDWIVDDIREVVW